MVMAQGFSQEQVKSILDDIDASELISDQTKALLKFAAKMTKDPYKMVENDAQALRNLGIKDEAILEAAHVASFFNYIDRMADAIGAPVEGMQAMVADMQAKAQA